MELADSNGIVGHSQSGGIHRSGGKISRGEGARYHADRRERGCELAEFSVKRGF
jgi:hypothetical protein